MTRRVRHRGPAARRILPVLLGVGVGTLAGLAALGRLSAASAGGAGEVAKVADVADVADVVQGSAPAGSGRASIGRPSAGTTPMPPPGIPAEPAVDTTEPVLLAAAGADHRWFVGRRGRGIGGYGIGHQGPEMASSEVRVVSGLGVTPRILAAWGPNAWVVSEPPGPGGESPVFSIRLARNTVHDVWYPIGRTPLEPAPRLPAGVLPLVAAASPDGPILVAAPRVDGGPLRLLRLGVERWVEEPLADPAGVPAAVIEAEHPLALAVVRLGEEPIVSSAGDAPDAADSERAPASAPAAPAGDGAAPPARATVETVAVTLLLLAGPEGLAIDLVGRSGERQRAWTGRPDVAAAALRERAMIASGAAAAADAGADHAHDDGDDGDDATPRREGGPLAGSTVAAMTAGASFHATIVEVDRRPWLATRSADRLVIEPMAFDPSAASPGDHRLAERGGSGGPMIEATVGRGLMAVVGGDSLLLLEGDGLGEGEAPTLVRAWTGGGLPDLEGPLTPIEVDPSVILRGPIIIGTGIFFAVIAGVLSSRPGPRPPAIEGREAPLTRRLGAAWIDALAPLVAAGLVFQWTPEALLASLLLLHPAGFAPWLGFTLLWSFATVVGDLAGGRTPGRLVMRIRPVDETGGIPGRGRLGLRFAIRTASVGFPPLIMFWLAHARSRGLHDLAARTWVIRTDRPVAAVKEPAGD